MKWNSRPKELLLKQEACSGGGGLHPLQCSCLENPMDGGALQAVVHGVVKSRTRLRNFTFMRGRRKWQPTPVFLPGESQGWQGLVGCRLWGCTESDTTEVTQQQQQEACGLFSFLCYLHEMMKISVQYFKPTHIP